MPCGRRRLDSPPSGARPSPTPLAGPPVGIRQDRARRLARGLVGRGLRAGQHRRGCRRHPRGGPAPSPMSPSVTGFPEMLDGRVKTLHPRVHGGILADRDGAEHIETSRVAAHPPFELVVVNLYPFETAVERPGITSTRSSRTSTSAGRRWSAPPPKNHASVAIVTSPVGDRRLIVGDRRATGESRSVCGARSRSRRSPHSGLRRAIRQLAEAHGWARVEPAGRAWPARCRRRYPPTLTVGPREGRDAALRREPAPAGGALPTTRRHPPDGPFATARPPIQGKSLTYNNVLDAAAADTLGRSIRGAGVGHRQAHQPVWRSGAPDAPRRLAGCAELTLSARSAASSR